MPLGRSKSVLRSLLTFCADQLEWCSPRRLHSVSTYNSSLKETLLDLRAPKFDMREVRQKRCQRQVGLVAALGFPR